MSSLKDIMDVDVEPLDSQAAYRRAKEAAQQQKFGTSIDQPSATPSPPPDDHHKGKAPIKRRRSDKASASTSTPGPNVIRRRSSAAPEAMSFNSVYQADMAVGSSNQASTAGSPQQSSRGSEQPTSEVPVKYTPVTGRISRAKKGVPVHICDICRPVKTFTRAEHLRRHKLSHQDPEFPCTFPECERAFHRPDLLARHLHRHETAGEKAYKSAASPSRRGSSSASERRTPPLKVVTPAQTTTSNQTSPTDSLTPRTSGGAEGATVALSPTNGSSQAVNFPPAAGSSQKRSASDAQLGPYSPVSPSSGTTAKLPPSFGHHITSSPFESNNETNLAHGEQFAHDPQQNFSGIGFTANSPSFLPFDSPHSLLLRIPEDTYGLSQTPDNSPWGCSSASDSTYSTQSEGSRNGRLWPMRPKAHSIITTADWTAPVGASQWPQQSMSTTPQDVRSPHTFDPLLDPYETPFSSPQMTSPTSNRLLLDVPNAFGGYYLEPVGAPALLTYNKPMAHFSASPTRVSDPGLASFVGWKDMVEPQVLGSLGSFAISSQTSYQTQLAQLEGYISSYWKHFDKSFPIIHRGIFDSTEDRLLSSAMAAIGTQYHNSPDARKKGVELNDYCRKSIGLCLSWNLHTMQAIFLTEIFTRFRGRKTNIETSRDFEELYTRVRTIEDEPYGTGLIINKLLKNSSREHTPFSTNSSNIAAGDLMLESFRPHQVNQNLQHSSLQVKWTQWADTEARQRLLAACFMFDIHQSMYHEQKRLYPNIEEEAFMPCPPCQDNIWNALSAEAWQVQSADCTTQQLPLIDQDLPSQYAVKRSTFTECLLIGSLAACFPHRVPTYFNDFLPPPMDSAIVKMRTQFPASPLAHSFLALHHTPLHELLAIAGDTWVFGKKITPPSAFSKAQSSLKVWTSSLAASTATQHACNVISAMLQSQSPDPNCISSYWALYTAALICWAFGYRCQPSSDPSTTSHLNSSSNPAMDIDSPLAPSADEAKLKALTYVNGILAFDTEELLTGKAIHTRCDTSGVIDAVLLRLEIEGVGSKCMMISDAIHVLSRIKEGARGNSKWF